MLSWGAGVSSADSDGGETLHWGDPASSVLTLLIVWGSIAFSVSHKLCSSIHWPLDACPHDLFAPGLECSWAFSEVGTDYWTAWPLLVVPDLLDWCLCPWNSPGKNIRVSCHFLLQGIFPTQGLNLHLLVSGIGTGRQVLWFFTTSPTCEAPREGRGDIKLEDKSSSLADRIWELRGMSLPSQGLKLASFLFWFFIRNVLVWDWLS